MSRKPRLMSAIRVSVISRKPSARKPASLRGNGGGGGTFNIEVKRKSVKGLNAQSRKDDEGTFDLRRSSLDPAQPAPCGFVFPATGGDPQMQLSGGIIEVHFRKRFVV